MLLRPSLKLLIMQQKTVFVETRFAMLKDDLIVSKNRITSVKVMVQSKLV